MCDVRSKCVGVHKEYSDVLQVPDNGNILEEFVIRDIAKSLVTATEVSLILAEERRREERNRRLGVCSIGSSSGAIEGSNSSGRR